MFPLGFQTPVLIYVQTNRPKRDYRNFVIFLETFAHMQREDKPTLSFKCFVVCILADCDFSAVNVNVQFFFPPLWEEKRATGTWKMMGSSLWGKRLSTS